VLATAGTAAAAAGTDNAAAALAIAGSPDDAPCVLAAAPAAESTGALGASFTPTSLGHATPTTKPIAVMTPALIHEGRSSAGVGTCTAVGLSAFRESIERTIITAPRKGRKPGNRPTVFSLQSEEAVLAED
jgi:hypothetical protein